MPLTVVGSVIFGPTVGQRAQQGDVVFIKRDHPVVEQVGCGQRRLAVVKLGEAIAPIDPRGVQARHSC
jgi:hypothetical protein